MEILELIFHLAVLVFVSGSMVAMGLSLRIGEILAPLRNLPLVGVALRANFGAVPRFANQLIHALPIPLGVEEGILILSLAAGAPFLPKLAYIARSDPALSVGLMLLLMVATLGVMPLALPQLLRGTGVDAGAIAWSLFATMLLPLLVALAFKHRYPQSADRLYPLFSRLSDAAVVILTVTLILLHYRDLLRLWGWGLVAILLFLLGTITIGSLFGGHNVKNRFILYIATAPRNISAAVLVAAQNFQDPSVTVTMGAAALLGLVLMLPYAHNYRRQCSLELLEELEEKEHRQG
jgi:BASS family bile acid:Na+ symporter